MKKLLLFASMLLFCFGLYAQEETVTLTFTGKQQNESYQQLDSVKVMNLTRNWTEVLYYPDTVLTMNTVGIPGWENGKGSVKLYQNVPNPFSGITDFKLMLLNKEKVDLVVFDINGKKVAEYHNTLPSGEHQFRATMSTPQTYLLSAVTKNGNTSIKMINLSNTGEQARIEYISSLPLTVDMTKKHTNYEFASGDNMQYVGYTTQNTGVKEATLTQTQQGSEEITFTFPTETFDPIVNVTTDSAGSVEMTTATLFGHYTVQYTTAKEVGFEYKKSADGEYASILASGTTASFSTQIKALEPNTEYTFKAYVTTEDSTYYGEEKIFTTEQVKETAVITGEATDINKRGATLHGSFVIGNEELMALGMDLKSKDGSDEWRNVGFSPVSVNPFAIIVENELEPGTTYLYRATATTMIGTTIYGEEKEFTTEEISPEMPEVETGRANTSSYDDKAAQLNGKVLSAGYCTMSEIGFYFGTTETPDKDGQKLIAADPTATDFTANTEILAPATTYYYVAFATNEVGTAYGEVKSFTTRNAKALPEVVTKKVNAYSTSAEVDCEVVSSGEALTERGICYSTTANPDTTATKKAYSTAAVGTYTMTMGELTENTKYYVRAYATSWAGIAYGDVIEFSTVSLTIPAVETKEVVKVGGGSATILSKLTVMGGSANLTVGVVCSDTVAEPTLENGLSYVSKSSIADDSTFTTLTNKLDKETKYYVRAYATNEAGTAYGNVLEFTTTAGFACGDEIEDIDGNIYRTVQIGTQCWTADNMKAKRYADGTELQAWNKTVINTWTNHVYAEITHELIGTQVLYNWAGATNRTTGNTDMNLRIQGVCPDGWHVPSYVEYATMFEYIDPSWQRGTSTPRSSNGALTTTNNADDQLAVRIASKDGHWAAYSGPGIGTAVPTTQYNATSPGTAHLTPDDPQWNWNTSGFSGIPAGYINKKSWTSDDPMTSWYFNGTANLWTSVSGTSTGYPNCVKLSCYNSGVQLYTYSDEMKSCYTVRCVKDPDPVEPEVKTNPAGKVTASTAEISGEVTFNGYAAITEKGFYYGTDKENVNTTGTKVVSETSGTAFSATLTELNARTTYYYTAYAVNEIGTGFGAVDSFTTPTDAVLATVETKEATNLLATSVTILSEVVKDGGELVTERGLCYGTTENPDMTATVIKDGKAEVGEFTTDITGLTSGITYHFRAYAITMMGTAYGNDLAVNMPAAELPEVNTDSVGDIAAANAVVYAKLSSNGNQTLIALGAVVDTLPEPTKETGLVFTTTPTDGVYTVSVKGLKAATKYYARAYAENASGVAYGAVVEFTTGEGFSCGNKLYDIEGNDYATVLIGTQCWMQENMRTKTMPDGTPMKVLTWSPAPNWGSDRVYYERTDTIYGYQVLYPWSTACNSTGNSNQDAELQGICPDGWHVPTYRQFADMCNVIDPNWQRGSESVAVGTNSGNHTSSTNKLAVRLSEPNAHWIWYAGPDFIGPKDPATYTVENTLGYNYVNEVNDPDANSSGFSAKPTGYWKQGKFYPNACLNMWVAISSTATGSSNVIKIASDITGLQHQAWSSTGQEGYAVRCVMNKAE